MGPEHRFDYVKEEHRYRPAVRAKEDVMCSNKVRRMQMMQSRVLV
jgi:hypothetical protein